MIYLINQTNAMMNRKITWIQENMEKKDTFSMQDKWLHGQMEKRKTERQEFDKQLQEMIDGKRKSLDKG